MSQNIEKQAVAKSFGQAAAQYDEYARIQHRVANQLLQQTPELAGQDLSILDLGCGTGYCLPLLKQKYPQAKITGADLSQGMLDYAQQHHPEFDYQLADAENLPFADQSFDLIFSNFAVQWCDSFAQVLGEAYRCLKPGGQLVLSTLADGTLLELKQAWQQADGYQHVNEFITEADLQQMVNTSAFTEKQSALSVQFEYYQSVRELTDSLKRIGAHNLTSGRAKGLTAPSAVKTFKRALESFREPQGLPARYEVFSVCLKK